MLSKSMTKMNVTTGPLTDRSKAKSINKSI
jgi:hypothetical protein